MNSVRYSITKGTLQQVVDVGATDVKEVSSISIIFASLTEEQASKLKALGCVVTKVGGVGAAVTRAPVGPPTPIASEALYTPQWLSSFQGLEQLRDFSTPPLYGSGINVAVIDTGIRETHELIGNSIVYSENFTTSPMRDGFNHGTGVTSIILAVVPQCGILNMKALDDDGEGTEEQAAMAIAKCIELHDTDPDIAPLVINLSLGSEDDGNPNNTLRVACRAAIDLGILVVAAAGNSGPDTGTIMSPACERYVGAVGSAKPQPYMLSSFSSRGPTKEGLVKPDAVFFGENILVASSDGDTATTAKSGTSFATPFGSGLIALFEEGIIRQVTYINRQLNRVSVPVTEIFTAEVLLDDYNPGICCKPEGVEPGKDNGYGYGLPVGTYILEKMNVSLMPDMTSVIGMFMMVGMMGMILPSMSKVS